MREPVQRGGAANAFGGLSGKYGVCESSQGGTTDGAEMVKESSERPVGMVAKLLIHSELRKQSRPVFLNAVKNLRIYEFPAQAASQKRAFLLG